MSERLVNYISSKAYYALTIIDTVISVPRSTTPTNSWDEQIDSLLRICNAQDEDDLPYIWSTIAPLSKDRAHVDMELVCRAAVERMHFHALCIPLSSNFMVLALNFGTP